MTDIVAYLYGCEIPCRKAAEMSEWSTHEDQSKLLARSEDRAHVSKSPFSMGTGRACGAHEPFFY